MNRNSELREELLQRFPSLAALWDHEPKGIKKGGKGIKKDDTRFCLRCGVRGHLMRDCQAGKKGGTSSSASSSSITQKGQTKYIGKFKDKDTSTCRRCGEPGHKMRDCEVVDRKSVV